VPWYDPAIEMEGHFVDARVGRAQALGKLGRYDEARADFERALAVKPELEVPLSKLPVYQRAMNSESP